MAQAPAEAPQPNGTSNGAWQVDAVARLRTVDSGRWLLGSIGVVYGDIGTSPLYAFKESFAHVLQDGTPASV